MSNKISVNDTALKIVEQIMDKESDIGVNVETAEGGSTIIDAGVKAAGSFEAGQLMAEICMGGLGRLTLGLDTYEGVTLPIVFVESSYPCEALLGSQFAGWRIDVEGYFAMASGPARALSLKPKNIYEEIQYKDKSDHAVVVLEADKLPTSEALKNISQKCNVSLNCLYVLVASTASLSGSVQISGRIAETGMHRLVTLGLNPMKFKHAAGKAPIAPIHPDSGIAMGRTNDVLLYGGETFFIVEDDANLQEYVEKAPSSSSRDYGRPFHEIFKAAGYDFYKIDSALFAPAVVTVNNSKNGKTYSAGEINTEVLLASMDYTKTPS
jgi:methenyltetrahydromethanopterin cyclohydrolase